MESLPDSTEVDGAGETHLPSVHIGDTYRQGFVYVGSSSLIDSLTGGGALSTPILQKNKRRDKEDTYISKLVGDRETPKHQV